MKVLFIISNYINNFVHIGLGRAKKQLFDAVLKLSKIDNFTLETLDNMTSREYDYIIAYDSRYDVVSKMIEERKLTGKIVYITSSIEAQMVTPHFISDLFKNRPYKLLATSKFGCDAIYNTVNILSEAANKNNDNISVNFFKYIKDITSYIYLYSDNNIYKSLDIDKNKYKNDLGIDTKFNFIFSGAITELYEDRKQIFRLIKLFDKAFNNDKNIGLILKLNTLECNMTYSEIEYIKNFMLSYLVSNNIRSKIYFIFNKLTDEQINILYNISDCFLSISSGEGFGYPFLEASLAGLPVLALEHSAYTEFVKVTPIEYSLEFVPDKLLKKYGYWYVPGQKIFAMANEDDFIKKVKKMAYEEDYYNYAKERTKKADFNGFISDDKMIERFREILK